MTFNWTTKDGINIFGKEWKVDQPKGVIALVHGFGEHCMRYDSMAQYYNQRGYAMIAYDRRGHGASGGRIGHTPSYDAWLDEIDTLIATCKERYPNVPLIIYGHSMGGNLVLNYMIERPDPDIKLIVVTGPWIRLTNQEPPAIFKAIIKLIQKVAPKFTVGQKIGTYISRVQEEVDKYNNDPLVHGKMSVTLASEMFKSCDRLDNFKGKLSAPALIMHGGDDQITSPVSSGEFAKRLNSAHEYKIFEGLYHEIHNESIREQVYDYALNWLDSNLK